MALDTATLTEDITEIRSLLSVLEDEMICANNGAYITNAEAKLIERVEDIKTGKAVIKGQIVKIRAISGSDNFGSVPAIVINSKQVSTTSYIYTFLILAGVLPTYQPIHLELGSSTIADVIELDEPMTDIMDELKETKLGYDSIFAFKRTFGLTHIYDIDTDSETFTSYF